MLSSRMVGYKHGGFKEAYTPQGTLKPEFGIGDKKNHSLWTAYFRSHISENSADSILVKALPPTDNRYLYVIDMQNDFLDKMYKNDDGNQIFGKFPVGEGASVIRGILSHAKDAITSTEYKGVIFSRDYHPEDHCSFGAGHKQGGSFPSHCVQGTKGAQLIDEIKNGVDFTNSKVKVIFKGIHPNADSFSAMPFSKARQQTSGPNCTGCSDELKCSNVTGGWELPDAPIDYNGPITFGDTVTAEGFTPVKYTPEFPDGSVIEVCGLAGDYCVRDTAIALATKYNNCIVVVINDLVRYPFVPLWLDCKMHTNVEARPVESHMAHLDYFLNTVKDKGFNYYIFDQSGKLMTPAEIQAKFSNVDALKVAINAEIYNFGPVYNHFLSDPRDIILDYKNSNVRIMLNPLITTGGRSHASRRRAKGKKSTKKRGRKSRV